MKFLSIWQPFKVKGEVNYDKSIAVPDQSLSVRQIIERSLRGTIDLNSLYRQGLEDDINPDIDDMSPDFEDLVDIDNAKRYYAELHQNRFVNRNHSSDSNSSTTTAQPAAAEQREEINKE